MAALTDEGKRLLKLKPIRKYREVMIQNLQASFPGLDFNELNEAITWAILNNYQLHPVEFNNNYTKQCINGNTLEILEYIQSLEPILTSSGVLFKKHKEIDNPLTKMIMSFIKQRKIFKKEMFKRPKGSAEFEKYNLLQLLEKLNANAVYGIIGAATSFVYNIYVAEAVTRNGRSYISQSIMLFEALLANNVKFNSLNEIIIFITNVANEENERKLNDKQILDRNITVEECFYKLMTTADMLIWVPTEKEMMLVWERLVSLSQEDINRLYYKNNLYTFCDLPVVTNLIIKILSSIKEPFMDPNNPPEVIKEDLDILVSYVKEYVYYKYPYIDKLDRIEYMQRDIVAISDTDSTIISFDAWYRFILDKVYNIDIPIKHEKFRMYEVIKADEFGDKPKKLMYELVEPILDYNFYTDEVIEIHKLEAPAKLIPQDTLRYAIINIIAYICSVLVVDYLDKYCDSANSNQPNVPCKMVIDFSHPIRVI